MTTKRTLETKKTMAVVKVRYSITLLEDCRQREKMMCAIPRFRDRHIFTVLSTSNTGIDCLSFAAALRASLNFVPIAESKS